MIDKVDEFLWAWSTPLVAAAAAADDDDDDDAIVLNC